MVILQNYNHLSLDKILLKVQKPARYIGGELNSIQKEWATTTLKIALAFPDLYEVGMSNLAMQILYGLLNEQPNILAERVFMPDFDLIEQLKTHNLSLFSLENNMPLAEFKAIGFFLSYELSYTNILAMLNLAQIPLFAKERRANHPFIFGGGHGSQNPEPLGDFLDFFVSGEAEEVMLEISQLLITEINNPNRQEVLAKLANIEGVFVPLVSTKPAKRLIIKDLDHSYFNLSPIVPSLNTVHARASLELMRGCPNQCNFCQAGFITLPKREKSVEVLIQQAQAIIANTGYEELSLLSLSSNDYSALPELVQKLFPWAQSQKLKLALPSLKLDKLDAKTFNLVQATGSSSITLAPEAGSQRMRDLINKNITEPDIERALIIAKQAKAKSAKLYFMIGLPDETDEDLQAIVDLAYRYRSILALTISVSTFVPKKGTPFFQYTQNNYSQIIAKQNFLKQKIKGRNLQLRWHEAKLSLLEGMISRGKPVVGQILFKAWQNGCLFDGGMDRLNWQGWLDSISEVLGLEKYQPDQIIDPYFEQLL